MGGFRGVRWLAGGGLVAWWRGLSRRWQVQFVSGLVLILCGLGAGVFFSEDVEAPFGSSGQVLALSEGRPKGGRRLKRQTSKQASEQAETKARPVVASKAQTEAKRQRRLRRLAKKKPSNRSLDKTLLKPVPPPGHRPPQTRRKSCPQSLL